jgi:hypothetical protein
VKEQIADLALENSFVVGLEKAKQRVWAKFNLPNKEIFELLLPIEDARRLSDGINQAIVALSADPSGSTH